MASRNEPIAIIGSACRFAGGVDSPAKLWELLSNPRDVRTEIPSSRFSADGFYHVDSQYHGHSNVRHAYVLEQDPGVFDAQFFGVKPVEAKALDPQQRLLLEVVYEGLEAAGIPAEDLRGSNTGVYVGLMSNDYESLMLRDVETMANYHAVGTQRSILANRISYFYDWHGPSMVVDTACSSSLVALHLAVQALRTGEARTALACGSNLLLGPENFVGYSKMKMLSPDGKSMTWDRDANGYARGEGVATVVLKTLSAALEDGDHIECIIRETGTNQDGATPGITMPSAESQRALIRDTYRRASLDPRDPADRCQYFEAHGTGTQAGDPIEAEAIYRSFFDDDSGDADSLYVGSLKSIIGHTEGTAGIASILKASLALQNKQIPPNLWFNNVNPKILPFCKNLRVPTINPKEWAEPLNSQPRRTSVNSFGFGGANAHAILEEFQGPQAADVPSDLERNAQCFTPCVFSAHSEKSLLANLAAYLDFLNKHPSVGLRDLAGTLRQRRSALPVSVAFSVSSIQELKSAISAKVQQQQEDEVGRRLLAGSPGTREAKRGILGVFTGQGAQYARMGAELVEKSAYADKLLQVLEGHLADLPIQDRPEWSLKAELLADAATSRLGEAAISQPLCTAVQILLVDLLRLANVRFSGVVGHSSGEIGAAYAAGYLSARDAMCIAYYRGLHSSPPPGSKGAMLAVEASFEKAQELCGRADLPGKISVAASNSSSSVTLSGDEDAIAFIEQALGEQGTFRRRLRVDRAYHSHHMLPCSGPYLKALESCNIQVQEPSRNCTWFTSTRSFESSSELKGVYWADNMTQPVLFSQAVAAAASSGGFDLALEVGPHPALKGPAAQTVLEVSGRQIPYHGTLSRSADAVRATSDALGFLWSLLGKAEVDLDAYESKVSGLTSFNVLKGLPGYQWDHDKTFWHESQVSRNMRLRRLPVHPLLGHLSPTSSPHHLSWRNVLRLKELPSLAGHELQGQVVFPAAGYLSSALEAASFLSDGRSIRLIQIRDFDIYHPIVLDSDDVEVVISLTEVDKAGPDTLRSTFTYSSFGLGKDSGTLTLVAKGKVEVSFGEPSTSILPPDGGPTPNMIPVHRERFYESLSELGYNYGGPFRALSSLNRSLGRASGSIGNEDLRAEDKDETPLMAQPGILDSAIQSILLAHSYPGDGHLWSLQVPTSIRQLRMNPSLCGSAWRESDGLSFRSTADDLTGSGGLRGDVSIYVQGSAHAAMQLEDVKIVPLAAATAADDIQMFSRTVWGPGHPDAAEAADGDMAMADELEFASVLERISSFYLRKIDENVPTDHPAREAGPLAGYLNFARHVNDLVKSGEHPYTKKEWLNDTLDHIKAASLRFADTPDVKILHTIGEQMPHVIEGKTTILEHARPNGLLDDYYVNALGLPQVSRWLANTVAQMTHRYSDMNILEVGAGTGGATKSILGRIGRDFSSYTFTDVSTGFFENAASTFERHGDRMIFKKFDAEQDPIEQGFVANSYDLVVASFVIHATSKLRETMTHLRRLLKPGGFVILAEITDNEQIRTPFIFGTLPGWWVGVDEGRTLSPCVSPESWDSILTDAGFSGIDTITPDSFKAVHPFSVFVSQAIDDRLTFLRSPLSSPPTSAVPRVPIEHLFVVGGNSLREKRLVTELGNVLRPYSRAVTVFKTLADVDHSLVTPESTLLSLVDLEKPVFKNITKAEFDSLKNLFGTEKTLLWVTQGRREKDPFANMSVGFGRTAVCEVPELRLQFLDVESDRVDARAVAEAVLRLQLGSFWAQQEVQNDQLWSLEPEVVIDDAGRLLVPRLEPSAVLNSRYNSARRSVVRNASLQEEAVRVCKIGDKFVLQEDVPQAPDTKPAVESPLVQLHATHTLVSAIKTPLGHYFLSVGVDPDTQSRYFVLTDSPSSTIRVPLSAALPVPASAHHDDGQLLVLLGDAIISLTVLDGVFPGQMVLVHNATPELHNALSRQAAEKGVNIVFTTSSTSSALPTSWTRLHPYMTAAEIKTILPHGNVDAFVGFSGPDLSSQQLESSVIDTLSPKSRVETTGTIFSSSSSPLPSSDLAPAIGEILRKGVSSASAIDSAASLEGVSTVAIADLAAGKQPAENMTVLEWPLSSSSSSVPVGVSRLDSRMLFKSDKTYWLAGLTGTLGLSLCNWMVEHGAKHVVITSRSPKVDPTWLATQNAKGANVQVMASDISSYDDVKSLYEHIRTTLPPLAGVAQGAMVLRDTSIRNMTFDQMTDVLRPKVDGSINLDSVLGEHPLDFFVFFSSILEITGNMGQANYTAANAFMSTLAAQRRKRGLAASVINIGVITGVGFVTREASTVQEKALHRSGLMLLSEKDMHQIFAEGIEASRLDSSPSGQQLQITAGLRSIPIDSADLPTWRSDPKFSRFIVQETDTGAGEANVTARASSMSSLKQQLQGTKSSAEAEHILVEALGRKIRSVLQTDTPDDALMRMSTDEIGLDSLIAVDIRSWLLKHFELEVPVLKLLGGMRLTDLVTKSVQGLLGAVSDSTSQSEVDEMSASIHSSGGTSSQQASSTSDDLPEPTPLTSTSLTDSGLFTKPEAVAERSLAISFSQSLFWVVDSLVEDKTAPNHTVLMRVVGQPRLSVLRNAVEMVGRHHEALRTRFRMDDEQHTVQEVLESPTLELEEIRVSDEADVMLEYDSLKRHVYDLGSGRLMRIILLSRSPSDNWLLVGFHHINVDGISFQVVMQDLDKLCRGQQLNPKTMQYPDFSEAQRTALSSGAWVEDIEYWKREFATIPEPLPLTRARITTRRPITRFSVHTKELRVDGALSGRIREVARANKVTSFHFYLTAFQILLHRFTGAEDMAIGVADSGRNDQGEVLDSVGPFLNLVPLRFEVTPAQTFGRLIADTRRKSYAGLAHSRVPFEVLLTELQVPRVATQSPIFQAFVDYRQGAQERQPLANCTLEMMELQMGSTGYDLSLDVIDNPEGDARIALMGQAHLYSVSDMDIIGGLFEDILNEFVQSPAKRISEGWQYRQADVERALQVGQGQIRKSEWPETLIGQFEVSAEKHKRNTALIHADGTSLTYAQMQQRIDTIAAALEENSIKPGDSVGVFQESTTDWVCSMMALWKRGAVFVPLDPGTKTERLAMVVKDCKPAAILIDDATKGLHTELGATETTVFINVSTLTTKTDAPSSKILASPDDLAMVYYTSGSTGNPKGIAVKHEGVRDVFESACWLYGVNEKVVTLLQSSLGFDITLIQMFISWPVGGTVCMISRDMRGDSVALMEFMTKHNVTHTVGTPSEYNSWLRFGDQAKLRSSAWRVAICGAEAFPPTLMEKLRELNKPDLQLFHMYGTTETTVYATQQELNWKQEGFYDDGVMPAGFSLPNKSMYIVDEDMHLLPVGLPGEIVLGGVGVAQGYNNNELMTKASFVPNTFAPNGSPFHRKGWTTMYRTRDRGRLLPDGSIVVEGRIGGDTEIKLRGLRIDLKDIEHAILRSADGVLSEAVASVRSTAGTDTQFLVAHVVFSPANAPKERQSFLRDLLDNLPLPRYMCPSVLVPIEKMPMSMSSKLDRRAVAALPVNRPDRLTAERGASQALNEAETRLKEVWEQVIPQGMFDIARDSDFFHVGGTSLLLVELQARIRQRFDCTLRLADLFANSMLCTMSKLIPQQESVATVAADGDDDGNEMPSMEIDWEWETRPAPELQIGTADLSVVVPPSPNPKSVIITGGAGFLGRSLLKSAIENPHIERVHAVAVRKLQQRLASGLLPQHPKVTYYDGDLREPLIGLSQEDADSIFNDIDAVIHNGADVSHLKSYFTLRRANLNATKELARLCLPRRIPFHYVSTAGVSMFTFWQSFGEETASAAEPPTDGTNGYKASKWASERFLERLNEKLGLPVWMHRPSDMVRQDDEEASWDLLHTLLGYSRKLRAVPVSENLWGWLDLVAVYNVSHDIVQMVHDNRPRSTDGRVSYVHQTGDMAIPIDEMKEFFEEECGYTHVFEKLPIEEWARRAELAGMRPAVAAVFGNVPRLPRALCFPRFVKTWRPAEGQDGGMLLMKKCDCGGLVSPVWGEGCEGCGKSPVMPVWG
ncbi:beta-ketoacyl synthase domain-containing protein [Colletotrichum eremochloae]|nr:beta-ketoacyl synthase domain-containing protein [Colletotrichum eremochloae]